jgi:NADH:ubiquinone oxidoreductase subunit 3 (subunit A)
MHGIAAALAIFFVTLVGFLSLRASERHIAPRESRAPPRVAVAGGGGPVTHYPMTLLFLAFDMEMVFMYPWAVVFVDEGLIALIEMFMFIVILLFGILYTWREGALEWA